MQPLPLDRCTSSQEKQARDYYRIRPLYLQNLLWELEIQGDLVGLASHAIESKPFIVHKKNPISEFSRKSRMRLLKFIARVNWDKCGDGLFVTLTYPDECLPRSTEQRNMDRYVFHRYVEKYLSVKIPMLWRVEWVERKSGKYRGNIVPHFHLIMFRGRFIENDMVRLFWRRCVKKEGALCTDIEGLGDACKIRMYIAKYAAKVPPPLSLDYVPQLNNLGRHYGYTRKPLIPMASQVRFVDLTPGLLATLRNVAAESLPDYDSRFDAGFVLLGDRARIAREEILKLALAEGNVPIYN